MSSNDACKWNGNGRVDNIALLSLIEKQEQQSLMTGVHIYTHMTYWQESGSE